MSLLRETLLKRFDLPLTSNLYNSNIFLQIAVATSVGKTTKENEDYYYYSLPNDISEKLPVFIIADGMGGHSHGNIVSKMTVESIVKNLQDKTEINESDLELAIAESDLLINNYKKAQNIEAGTTIIISTINENILNGAYVGDSRIYCYRNSSLIQLTKDHSYVNELIDQKVISIEQAKNHPKRNLLSRAIGSDNAIPDFFTRNLESGDILIMCSDGLYKQVSDLKMKDIIQKTRFIKLAQRLVEDANISGGIDNTTVICIRIN